MSMNLTKLILTESIMSMPWFISISVVQVTDILDFACSCMKYETKTDLTFHEQKCKIIN
jgi:hypothetical protein